MATSNDKAPEAQAVSSETHAPAQSLPPASGDAPDPDEDDLDELDGIVPFD